MSAIDQTVAELGLTLPEIITGHIAGESVAVDPHATHHAIHFPGTGEQITSLQEDDAEAVDRAISTARDSFASGSWSDAGTATRQAIFRKAARLIRDNAEELALLECLCAGLPSTHLASRQVPRAADNLDFFADYIGVMAGETFDQLSGYQTQVTRQPAGVAALFAPWNAPLALSSMQLASSLAFGNTCVLKPSEFTPLSILRMVALMEEAGVPPGTLTLSTAVVLSLAQRWPAQRLLIALLLQAAAQRLARSWRQRPPISPRFISNSAASLPISFSMMRILSAQSTALWLTFSVTAGKSVSRARAFWCNAASPSVSSKLSSRAPNH